jgi:DNA-binding NarL/FixJ family response regulator/tetratricopeptide (TPR) repeat protein
MLRAVDTAAGIVGREAERRTFRDRRRQALAGEPGAVLVVGDAGVGKSTLLEAACDDAARDGWQVHVGHCVELAGGALPFGPVTEVLRRIVAHRGREWLTGAVAAMASALDPLVDATGVAEATDRPGVLAALVATISALGAEQPAVLAVEDVHWADRSTLDALDLAVRTVTDVPVLIVATLRGDELHRRHPTRTWAAELSRHPRVTRLDLAPFGLDDLAALVARVDGRPADLRLVHELYRRTDGNAFFAEALLASPPDQRGRLPERLSDVLLARLDALPPAARRVVDVAAAAARGMDHRLLDIVAGLDGAELRDGVRHALDAGLLVRTGEGSGYRLRHALLREVAHDELLPGDREDLHRALATALEAQPDLAMSPTGPHGELAHHWEQARDHARTYAASLAAAREAAAITAYAESLEHLERALSLHRVVPEAVRAEGPRRDRLLHDAGVAALTAGLGGAPLLRAAADEARACSAPVADVLQSLLRLAYAEWSNQRPEVAIAVAEEATALVDDAAPELQMRALGELSRLQMLVGRMAVARPLAQRAVALAPQTDAPLAESVARNSLAVALGSDGFTDEAIDQLRAALRLARRAMNPVETARAITNLTSVLVDAGRVTEAERTLDELTAMPGMTGHRTFATLNVAEGLLDELRIDEAARYIAAVRVTSHYDVIRLFTLRSQAALALHRGDLADARRLAAEARAELADPLPYRQDAVPLLNVAVAAALLDGDAPAAFEASTWLLDHADRWPGSALRAAWYFGVRAAVAVALTARTAGDDVLHAQAAARALAWQQRGEQEAATRSADLPAEWTAQLAATRALVARLSGTAADAWEAARQELRAARGLPRVLMAVDAATDLSAAGRDRAARALLDDAAEHLARLPATHPLRAVARDLRAALDEAGDSLLTPREREVIALVAQGRTNREIGNHLFVSEKTASVHVSNILRKLDAGNRVEAAATARRLGLV